MTEAEWLASNDPEQMLCYFRVKDRRPSRKFRLYAVACCHYIWHLVPDPRSRMVVEVAERYADALATEEELRRAAESAEVVHRQAFDAKGKVGSTAEWCVVFSGAESPFHAARTVNWMAAHAAFHHSKKADEIPRIALLQDIFSYAFHPTCTADFPLTSNVVGLAQSIYQERGFDRMPILGDALEDAGCTNQAILGHCRGPGPHVRGCWVVDLLLPKE